MPIINHLVGNRATAAQTQNTAFAKAVEEEIERISIAPTSPTLSAVGTGGTWEKAGLLLLRIVGAGLNGMTTEKLFAEMLVFGATYCPEEISKDALQEILRAYADKKIALLKEIPRRDEKLTRYVEYRLTIPNNGINTGHHPYGERWDSSWVLVCGIKPA